MAKYDIQKEFFLDSMYDFVFQKVYSTSEKNQHYNAGASQMVLYT